MKPKLLVLTCIVLGMSSIFPHAEGTVETAGIEFDFNQDGITDRKDWDELSAWVKTYRMEDEDGEYYTKQEVPATIGLMINEYYGNRQTEDYGVDVSALPQYYLPSVGDSTIAKSQGAFSSCWAFSAISSVESNLLRKRNGTAGMIVNKAGQFEPANASDEIDLSEFYHAYMNMVPKEDGSQKGEGAMPLHTEEPNVQFSFNGFGGANQNLLTSWTGPLTEEQEPYEPMREEAEGVSAYGLRNSEEDKTAVPAAHIQQFVYLDAPNIIHVDRKKERYVTTGYDPDAIRRLKQAVITYGAVMLEYGSDSSMPTESGNGEYYNYANWAQYYDEETLKLNHMVSIVGWNDSFPKENFRANRNSIPEGDGAFLIKNSWGSYDTNYETYEDQLDSMLAEAEGTENEAITNRRYNYGIKDENGHGTGYFWLSYYDRSMTGACALSADDAQDGFDYDNIYQYDFAVQMSIDPVSLPTDNEETKVANIFTAENDELLSAVSVYAPAAGAQAEIRIIKINETSDLSSGEYASMMDVSLKEKGFHTVALETPVSLKKGESFAVVERVVTEHEGRKLSWLNLEQIIKPSLQTDDNIGECRLKVVSNPNESYAYVKAADGYAWTDIETLNQETDAADVFEFGNACIKAYTVDNDHTKPAQMGTAGPSSAQKAVGWVIIAGGIVYYIFRKRKPSEA